MRISDFALFAGAHEDEVAQLEDQLPRLRRADGETLYRRGDESGGLYLLEEGLVRFDRATRSGTRFASGFCVPTHMFGELELIAGTAREADAVAITEIRFRFLPVDVFRDRFARSVWFARNLCVIGNQVRRVQSKIYRNAMTMGLSGRAAWWLVSMSQHRAGSGDALRVSQEELAQIVGVARQTINRQLREWQEQGWISLGYGAVSITNWHALMAEAGMLPP